MFILVGAWLGGGDCFDKFGNGSKGHTQKGPMDVFNDTLGVDHENASSGQTQRSNDRIEIGHHFVGIRK